MKETIKTDTATPGRKLADILLLIIFWATVSPLMLAVNRHERYMSKRAVWLAIVFSPFTFYAVFVLLLPLAGIDLFPAIINGIASRFNLGSLPEVAHVADNHLVLFLHLLAMPVYAACVVVLFAVMACTGWSYITASVYVCEYFAPLACVAVALVIAVRLLCRLGKLDRAGKMLSVTAIAAELLMAAFNVQVYFERLATYAGMNHREIFRYVVDYLLQLGQRTHTNYVLANIMVYIVPMALILAIVAAGRHICQRHKKTMAAN